MILNLLNNRYKILRELGAKTGRKTCLAEDMQTQNQVVIKILSLGGDFDWQDLKLFEREAQTLQTLNHSQIPKYLDAFEFDTEDGKGFALVQEYIAGETLEAQLRTGRVFSETEVKQIARSLLAILIYLHSFNPPIIHRDIKPSNIILTNRSAHHVGDVFLVDFGAVQNIAATEGGTITVVGTYGYMPPEQFGGRTTLASDLYSLGATLIFLVTGLHPSELPERELRIGFRNHCQISAGLADWLEWMSEPSQTKRFKTAQIALEQLDNPPPRPVLADTIVTNSPIQKISKPQNSKITVEKNADYLDIVLPSQGLGFVQILLLSAAAPLAIIGSFTFRGTMTSTLFSWERGIAIAFIILLLSWMFYKRTRIRFSKHENIRHVRLYDQIFGFNWTVANIKLQKANQKKLLDEFIIGEVKNKIYLDNNVIYRLDDLHKFTVMEKAWLIQEMRHWLAE